MTAILVVLATALAFMVGYVVEHLRTPPEHPDGAHG